MEVGHGYGRGYWVPRDVHRFPEVSKHPLCSKHPMHTGPPPRVLGPWWKPHPRDGGSPRGFFGGVRHTPRDPRAPWEGQLAAVLPTTPGFIIFPVGPAHFSPTPLSFTHPVPSSSFPWFRSVPVFGFGGGVWLVWVVGFLGCCVRGGCLPGWGGWLGVWWCWVCGG